MAIQKDILREENNKKLFVSVRRIAWIWKKAQTLS